jgi:hypothetical protein
MTEKQRALLQRKLDRLAKLANDLDDEAKALFGRAGNLFFEADGTFHLMDGDCDGNATERHEHIQVSSTRHCRMGCGAW